MVVGCFGAVGQNKMCCNLCRLVCGIAALFILRRDSQTALPKFSVSQLSALKFGCCTVAIPLPVTVCGLAKGGIFSTKVNTKNRCLFLHKCFYEARQPAFCQTAVIASAFHSFVSNKYLSCVFSRLSFTNHETLTESFT